MSMTRRRLVYGAVVGAAAASVAAAAASAARSQEDDAPDWISSLLCLTRKPGDSPAERRRAERRRWGQERNARAVTEAVSP